MKVLKQPIFWIVIAFLLFLAYVFVGYSQPAQVQFINDTKGELRNVLLSYGTGEVTLPILPVGASPLGPLKIPSGELSLTLQSADGRPHSKVFTHRAGPRQNIVFRIVESQTPVTVVETHRSWASAQEDFTFNLLSTED
jgi:hypothetical protein